MMLTRHQSDNAIPTTTKFNTHIHLTFNRVPYQQHPLEASLPKMQVDDGTKTLQQCTSSDTQTLCNMPL